MASLAAALLGGEPLVSLLSDGQTDSLSSGQGHPRLVALQMSGQKMKLLIKTVQFMQEVTGELNLNIIHHIFCKEIIKTLQIQDTYF